MFGVVAGLVAALGQGGVDVNEEDQDGNKLLHIAATTNSVSACKVSSDQPATPFCCLSVHCL